MRRVIVTDSAASPFPARDDSINRKSGLFSAQKFASASSLSKIGTSSQLATARITRFHRPALLRQSLFALPLIEEPFLRLKRPRMKHSNLLAVGSIHAEHSNAASRHPQVEKPRLNRKARRIRQHPQSKRIFKRFLYLTLRQRTVQIEGRVIP